MNIKEQARAHALAHFNHTYGDHWHSWPEEQKANAFTGYEQGFLDAYKLANPED